jgi:hypothetical protein
MLRFPFPSLQPWIHYENAETKRRLHNLLCVSGLTDRMSVTPIAPQRAPIAHISRHVTMFFKNDDAICCFSRMMMQFATCSWTKGSSGRLPYRLFVSSQSHAQPSF